MIKNLILCLSMFFITEQVFAKISCDFFYYKKDENNNMVKTKIDTNYDVNRTLSRGPDIWRMWQDNKHLTQMTIKILDKDSILKDQDLATLIKPVDSVAKYLIVYLDLVRNTNSFYNKVQKPEKVTPKGVFFAPITSRKIDDNTSMEDKVELSAQHKDLRYFINCFVSDPEPHTC